MFLISYFGFDLHIIKRAIFLFGTRTDFSFCCLPFNYGGLLLDDELSRTRGQADLTMGKAVDEGDDIGGSDGGGFWETRVMRK